jgi:hypothetical protein
MMTRIKDYLINTKNMKPQMAEKISQPFEKHNDIRVELIQWIDTKTYPQENPITINGYTAEKISSLAPFMDGVGVYNFMITLRERPEKAEKIIANGFPRK